MEAAIAARSSCARVAYTANARATTTVRESNHRLYLLMLKNDTFLCSSNHFWYYVSPPSRMGHPGSWLSAREGSRQPEPWEHLVFEAGHGGDSVAGES
jgi:hypothetical protein